MEASRSRCHGVGVPGRRGVVLDQQQERCVEGSIMPDGEQQPGLKSASSTATFSGKRRRRQSAGGRRRSKGGSSDFSFSPYQPMIIETKSSSVSPRPRRASAPTPPASLLLHKRLMDGEQQETAGTAAGPTLEQCLVLPPGLALKIDGLLSHSQPPSKLGEGPESEDGGGGSGGGGGDRGGGGGGLDQAASNEREGGNVRVERGEEGGLHAGDERAIISTYTFRPSNLQAAAAKGEALEHVLAADELGPVSDAVAISDDGPSDTSDGGAEEGCTTPAGVMLNPGEARSSAGAPASPGGVDDETTGASAAATTVAVAGDEPAEEPVTAGEEPGVLGSSGGEDELASDLVADSEAFDDDDAVVAGLPEEEEGKLDGDGIDPHGPASSLAGSGGEGELMSGLDGDSKAFDDAALMAGLQEEVEFGSGGVDPHRAASSPPPAVDVEPAAALVDADAAAAEGSLTQKNHHEEENRVLPQAVKPDASDRPDPAAGSYGTVETNDEFPILEAGEGLDGGRAVTVTGGGGVAAAAGGGGEDDYEKDGRFSEEEIAEGAEAATAQLADSDVAREECGGGGKVGCIQEEESSASPATEASNDGGDVGVEEGNEHPGPQASEEMAVGVVLASATAAATTTFNDSSIAGKTREGGGLAESGEEIREHETGQVHEVGGEGGASGAITSGATATVSCYPATIGKREGAEEENEEKDVAATSSKEKQESIAAAETTASSSTVALEVVADAAPPAVDTKHPESGTADAGEGAPSPAVDAHSSHVSGVAVSSVAKDNSETTAPDVVVQEEEEFPLDWEALAREVEAEWVMEGSDGESDASLSPAPPPVSPPLPHDVAVAFVGSPSANDPVRQQKEEEVSIGSTSTGEGKAREPAGDVPGAPPAAAATRSSHPWAEGHSSGTDDGSVAHTLEDSKEEAEDVSDYYSKKEAADDSDCGSAVPASSEGEGPIPVSEARLSTHATTRNSGGQQQCSASVPPAGTQLPQARTPAIGPLTDDTAGSVARVEASPAPARPPVHGSSVAEQVDGSRGNHDVPSSVPVPARTTQVAPPFSDGGRDGGTGVPQHPEKESARREVGRGGGGCAASCGCVVM